MSKCNYTHLHIIENISEVNVNLQTISVTDTDGRMG